MNRIGLKDYLLNEASDSDLLDCAKAYDTANQYGHFDTYDSVEEAAKLCGWDVETALSESRHVESDADCYRFNGYGHLEAVSNERLRTKLRRYYRGRFEPWGQEGDAVLLQAQRYRCG